MGFVAGFGEWFVVVLTLGAALALAELIGRVVWSGVWEVHARIVARVMENSHWKCGHCAQEAVCMGVYRGDEHEPRQAA